MIHARTVGALLAPVALAAALLAPSHAASALASQPLTNLSHLDWLTTSVTVSGQPNHTTYRLRTDRAVGVLWVYANRQGDGSYQRTGGGGYDPATNTYGQGAYDADDISRAAVVYLRHWRLFGDAHSRDEARQLLRGLTYLQDAAGPDAGDVVLWMQPDGTLNPTPTPADSPNPSDTGPSYWLARTIWALGEGYAAFAGRDPAFAAFLADRLDLAVGALDRQLLVPEYGRYHLVNGVRMPSWLIADGADASSEATLGLAAYADARPADAAAVTALRELASGVAAMAAGSPSSWPYGAILPWDMSPSDWHAWGDEMATGLASAARTLHDPALLRPAVSDTAVFLPHLLTATGPDNGWIPAPVDGSQIAYGADSVVRSLLSVSAAAHSPGLRQLAGIAAGWFFGQNTAGVAMYDPATGVEFDGVAADGTINRNSGAESTIHALLTMEALDQSPDVAAIARSAAQLVSRDGQQVVEADTASLQGGAVTVTPPSTWTGEAQWSASSYVSTPAGSKLTWQIMPSAEARLVQPVAYLVDGGGARTTFSANGHELGTVRYGTAGPQGVSAAPGALLPVTLPSALPAGVTRLDGATAAGTGQLDSVLLTPLVSTLITSGGGHAAALLNSVSGANQQVRVTLPGSGTAWIWRYDEAGGLAGFGTAAGAAVSAGVLPGGFTIILRS